ncbi:hypothetical protein [Acetobacter tropicalis]|uniref:hypothetical protein n=1 Tax=Acetobacter tropicalis TaxID=104102 RepID=UPI001FC9DB8F|nr:hypothetical protein [Acetobacter tropicalis]
MTRTSPFAESLFSRIRLDLACGIGLLTRLPINGLLSARQRAQSGPWPLARSLWCWPLVGGAWARSPAAWHGGWKPCMWPPCPPLGWRWRHRAP